MISSEQIRAARVFLRWTIEDLAKESSVSVRTLKAVESKPGSPGCRLTTLEKIRSALESAGIEFIGTPDDRPGIRLARKS